MRRLILVAGLLLSSLVLAPSVAAADPVFGPATARATFGEAIEIEQPVTLTEPVHRVEALVRAGREGRTLLATIPTPAQGASTLRYRHETPFGSLYPNTVVTFGFRVTLDDGRIFDSPTRSITYEDDRFAWNTLEGDLVRVHWIQGDGRFGQRALAIAERAVDDATSLLGVEETEPIVFFVYGDRDAFADVLGPAQRENVGGIALAEIRTLFAHIAPSAVDDAWVGIVIPHELVHLVFDTATRNDYHAPPHWLNEGLADYLAQGYGPGARAAVESAARTGELMPLKAIVGSFPTTGERFSLAYDESVSAIDYLIRTHGQDALVQLIRSYADGVSDDVAFSSALGVDAAGFEAGWLADLGVDEPPAFGPQPAPPGPLPPGWNQAPAPTLRPGETPRPTPGSDPADPGTGDLSGPVAIGVVVVLVVLLVGGLIVAARGLSRGDPLLPTSEAAAEPAGPTDDDPGPGPWDAPPVDAPPVGEPPADEPSDDRPLDDRLPPRTDR